MQGFMYNVLFLLPLIIALLGKKFRGDTWDMKILQQRINQDTKVTPTPTEAQVEDALLN